LQIAPTRRGVGFVDEVAFLRAGGSRETDEWLLRAIAIIRDARGAIYQRTRLARLRALRDENYQGLMSRRLALRKYGGAFRIRLADYERWLPEHTTQAFKHYREEGVPLLVIGFSPLAGRSSTRRPSLTI
jgi:hypothetical protein